MKVVTLANTNSTPTRETTTTDDGRDAAANSDPGQRGCPRIRRRPPQPGPARSEPSGMLLTFEARLGPSPSRRAGHIEVLQVLCHDEIARRESEAIACRIRRAGFEQQSSLGEFDFAVNPTLPTAEIRDLAALRWLTAGESVALYGPVGVGRLAVLPTRRIGIRS